MSTDVPLKVDPDQLPADTGVLKLLVVQLHEALQESRQRVTQLEHHMDLLVRKVFGRTSEKLDPAQLTLFDKQGQVEEANAPIAVPPTAPATANKKAGHGRRKKPDALERRDVPHDLSDAELAQRLRTGTPAVVARLQDDRLLLDLRTIFPQEEAKLVEAVRRAVEPSSF